MKKLFIFTLIMVIIISAVGCGSSTANKGKVDSIKEKGVLKLGTEAGYPPFEFTIIKDGNPEIVGIDIEIAKLIAKELGVELEVVDMDFNSLLAALSVGDVDIVLAGMNPSEERRQSVDFSDIYYADKQVMLVRTADKDTLTSIDDFKGKTIGAQMGTIPAKVAEEIFKESEFQFLAEIANLVMELKAGTIDGVVLGFPTATAYDNAHDDIFMPDFVVGSSEEDGVAAAVAKDNKEFLDIVNKVLNTIMEDGTLEKIIKDASVEAGI
ncbi:MAG: transporter substrate-binding domain-containing protein [Tissierellia bacterium]|nr:transporter substrate-binding domain-containing protein [Tissierellia bacterium]